MIHTLLVGRVQSGGPGNANRKPLASVHVTVFEATAQQPLIVGSATTDAEGLFELQIDRAKSERIFYAVAKVSQDIELVTIIGSALQYDRPAWITASPPKVTSDRAAGDTAYVTINELTTVAATFSSPLMRQTAVEIDQAGNVWAMNNWKPTFKIDAAPQDGNPGGDGAVIFVGLAKPAKKRG
jgi:hypothetical protein